MKRLRSPPKTPSGDGNRFLADEFPESRPLKMSLSALRASQARILTRNLRAVGATVLFRDEDGSQASPIVVVTDRVPETEEPGVTYVPPRWAEEVLRRRRPVSPKRFSLAAAKARAVASLALSKGEKSKLAGNGSTSEKASRFSTPAVWQTDRVKSASALERAKWIASIPEYAAERATYTESVTPSPNAAVAGMLRNLARVRELAGNGEGAGAMQARAFRNAAAALSVIPFEVSAAETMLVRDVGSSAADVVKEFLENGECREAKLLECDARVKALDELSGVYGIGFKTARKLFDAGVNNVEELVEFAKKQESRRLVKGVAIFDRPYDALTIAEATAFRNMVSKVLEDAGMCLQIVLCGGYRRCKPRGHDVDIVYCRRETSSASELETLQKQSHATAPDKSSLHKSAISVLSKSGLLAHRLNEAHGGLGGPRGRIYGYSEPLHAQPRTALSHEVLHGVCKFQGQFFRADFVAVRDAVEMPYATLAWSGSITFQRSLRRWTVAKRGLVFSPHGLFDAATGNRAEAGKNARTEHDIFAALKLPYRPPYERAA